MPDINVNIKIPAAEKLIDVAVSGIGSVVGPLLLPYKAKMQAKASIIEAKGKADSTKLIAQAQAEARDILTHKQDTVSTDEIQTDIKMDTENLIQTKIHFQERKRLNNLQSIFVQAKEKLPGQVNNKPVDPDWTARFFQNAQDISTKEMQQIWSSILAGEVEIPGKTSLRTLEILKNMTKKEAELFNETMKYKIQDFIFLGKNKKLISYGKLLFLEELDLLNANPHLVKKISVEKKAKNSLGKYCNHILRLNTYLEYKEIGIPSFILTKPAMELASFLNHSINRDYLKQLAQFFKTQACQLQITKTAQKESSDIWYENNFKPIEP